MDKPEKKKSEQEIMQDFADAYQKLCDEHKCRIVVTPAFTARDDGTFSVVLQYAVGRLPKQ